MLSILAKTLETSVGWNSQQYGYITASFQAAYAVGLLTAGRLIDRLGTRKGYAIGITAWSIAAISHAAATSAFTFGVARALLGLGEAANFPACIKTVAEWFPKQERALATGIFNSGSNIGATIAPLAVPWLALTFGWQSAFIVTGALGFVWLAFWLAIYRKPEEHPRISDSTRFDSERPSGQDRIGAVDQAVSGKGDVGLRIRETSHRSGMVVFVLVPEIFTGNFRPELTGDCASGAGGLQHFKHRQRFWRMAFVAVDQARLER